MSATMDKGAMYGGPGAWEYDDEREGAADARAQRRAAIPSITREQITAGVQTVAAIAEAIRELGTVSDGTLYAGLMGKLSLGQYQAIIAILVKAGLVSNNGHQLHWIGGLPR